MQSSCEHKLQLLVLIIPNCYSDTSQQGLVAQVLVGIAGGGLGAVSASSQRSTSLKQNCNYTLSLIHLKFSGAEPGETVPPV